MLNDSYETSGTFVDFFSDLIYPKIYTDKKVIFLQNNGDFIGMLIYKIHKYSKFNILVIEELCVKKTLK